MALPDQRFLDILNRQCQRLIEHYDNLPEDHPDKTDGYSTFNFTIAIGYNRFIYRSSFEVTYDGTLNIQNGCLQVIKGSHKLGRINHGFAGEQVGADMVMVNNALKTMDLVYVEIEPGDALFFHSNILHRSEANLSDHPRWSIISCYASQSNLAYNENSTSWKTPIELVPDNAITDWESTSLSNADFLKKENDPALKETGWEK
jgi:hypothetical protein